MTVEQTILEKVIHHEYLYAFYGVFVYYVIIYRVWKMGNKNGKFHTWWKSASAGAFATLVVAPMVIIFDDEVAHILSVYFDSNMGLGDWVYITAGPITDLLTRGIVKLRS